MVHFKQMFENTIQGAAAPWGGVFQNLFENGPHLAHPIFKVAIRLFFQTFTI